MDSSNLRSATNTTTRRELSLLYRVLRRVIRPFRPRLVQLGKPLPAGSPKLSKRPRSIQGVRIEERLFQIHSSPSSNTPTDHDDPLWLYDFVPGKSNVSDNLRTAKHVIYYFAGGGFQSPPSSEHWKLCAKLAGDLHRDAPASVDVVRVCLVSYPLAPNSPAVDSLPVLQRWLKQVVQDATEKESQVTLMGDSAGANVAISLGMWWAEQLQHQHQNHGAEESRVVDNEDAVWMEKARSEETLRNIVAISPPCDLRNQNPKIQEADKHDPVLSVALTDSVAQAWAKGSSTSHPSVTPNLGDFSALKQSKIKVHGVIGTHDVLAPDALVFKGLCEDNDIPGEWLVWEGQMHCFPLAGCYGMMEGKEGVKWLETVLQDHVR